MTSPKCSSPRRPHAPAALLVAAVLAAAASLAGAHTWIGIPHTYNTNFPTRRCLGTECTNACPYIRRRNRMINLPDRPQTTWRRGQRVQLSYMRNNHHGGFVRFSIVPQPLIFSRRAHKRFTWFHSCWQAGQYNCKLAKHPCGTDKNNTAFRRFLRVPRVFPDGDYILGMVWYGGLHYKEKMGQFPDYYSCTFIRIKGGPMSFKPFKPFFFPGRGEGRGVRRGRCHTSASTVGPCDRWGCRKKRAYYGKPRPFWGKKRPPAISVGLVKRGLKAKTWYRHLLWGSCNYKVCCPRRCGPHCGGKWCGTGGRKAKECCPKAINKTRRKCRWVKPPCIRH